MPRFNGVTLTPESLAAARQWYADNWRLCLEEAESGRQSVNDLATYRAWCLANMEKALTDTRLSFAMLQRAYFIQTGESVALLP